MTGSGTTTLNYSCYSNEENDIVPAGGSDIFTATNNNITVDPMFVDITNNDFRIIGISNAVNTGQNSYNSTITDIRGQSRIQNTTIDMGAYEWTDGVDPEVLGIPNNLTIERAEFTTTLSWTSVSGASGYNIYRSINPNSGFELIGSTSQTTFEDNESLTGNFYFYYVKATTGTLRK